MLILKEKFKILLQRHKNVLKYHLPMDQIIPIIFLVKILINKLTNHLVVGIKIFKNLRRLFKIKNKTM